MGAPGPTDDVRRRVLPLLEAYVGGHLPPPTAFLFEVHRNRCPTCGEFLRSLERGAPIPSPPPVLLKHIDKLSGRAA